ncbi:thioesterase II family protein [Brevibacillus laterosporus]|uniref:thioesterase II family protein n=1 Tax=Brevibacillus laterosporus TaxID=1465 RepID=UPI000CE41721|nr:thioesterase domain-containing protein [Brevibacillus laterosporus]MED1665858.1 thioesterase domain-containing protein [Brevibacillus laterosporus]MED1671212.1 thioesterase domain-containing protein [Brevibacillus laterosporus]MED1717161.1 thioesterase domain-containing protein [Brevibacillus laterosporus]PPA84214.1 putative thioesterase [Brevibacillus laterosporus]
MLETDQTATPWLITHPEAKDIIRLFCFPYAGGGASAYRGWTNALPDDVGVYPIQLPGRENRITEQALCEMEVLVEAISQAIYPYLDRPFIFFGHSLGARVAFELTRTVRRKWKLQPCRLIVSGSRAPHIPEPNPLHHLPDDEFINELRRFSGTPEAILQNRDLMNLFLPVLRADFTVDETYVYEEEAILKCPISAFGGTEDTEANREEIEVWADHTSSAFTLEMIEGDHFFLTTKKDLLLPSVAKIVEQHREVTLARRNS